MRVLWLMAGVIVLVAVGSSGVIAPPYDAVTPTPAPDPVTEYWEAPHEVIREYPERRADGSVWLVREWSRAWSPFGRFEDVAQVERSPSPAPTTTATPSPPSAPFVVRSYMEQHPHRSFWAIREWSDGRREVVYKTPENKSVE